MKYVNIAMTEEDYMKLKQGAVKFAVDTGELLTVTEYCRKVILHFNDMYLDGKVNAPDKKA